MNSPIYESAPKAFVIHDTNDKVHINYLMKSPEGVILNENTSHKTRKYISQALPL